MAKKASSKSKKQEELEDIELSVSLGNHVDYGHVPGLRTYKGDIEALSPRQKAMLAKVKSQKEGCNK
ncbi:MAG: hypothetical protein E7104_06455 [Prevotella sp.]|nr:hypothetical protein [Prevotella sp.]MBE6263587.1 hypothetical protein [Prevotella sp.]